MNALSYIESRVWAMYPRKLDELRAMAVSHPELDAALQSMKVPEAIATRSNERLDGTRYADRRNNVAVVNINGTLFTSGGLIDEIMAIYLGGTSTKALARDIQTAIDDASIDAIVLNINSGGGEAFGINEVANLIYSVRGKKPIVSYVYGLGASAAYWLAAGADQIIVDAEALVGSIGVVAAWADFTGFYEQMGIAYEEITSSNAPYKRLDVRIPEQRTVFQSEIDGIEKVFINSVAKFRGVSRETVVNEFGKGSVMAGHLAAKAGMADTVGSLEETLRLLSSKRTNSLNARPGLEGDINMGFKEEFKSFAAKLGFNLQEQDPENPEQPDVPEEEPEVEEAPDTAPLNKPEEEEQPAAADVVAELQKKLAEAQTATIRREASAFVDAEIKAGRLLPAEKERFANLYALAAEDDERAPLTDGSRVESLKALQSTRKPHGFTEEKIDASQVLIAGNGATITEEREKELLDKTPLGKSVLTLVQTAKASK